MCNKEGTNGYVTDDLFLCSPYCKCSYEEKLEEETNKAIYKKYPFIEKYILDGIDFEYNSHILDTHYVLIYSTNIDEIDVICVDDIEAVRNQLWDDCMNPNDSGYVLDRVYDMREKCILEYDVKIIFDFEKEE